MNRLCAAGLDVVVEKFGLVVGIAVTARISYGEWPHRLIVDIAHALETGQRVPHRATGAVGNW